MNLQRPEPRAKGDGISLDFHSMFFTIQGEGPFAGHRAIFVRLAGCNLQCPGCDTEYTQGRRQVPITDLFQMVIDMAATAGFDPRDQAQLDQDLLVVITGGEPLRQPIGRFVGGLIDLGFCVQIESNGVFAPDPVLARTMDSVRNDPETFRLVISPKTSRVNEVTASYAHAWKYVLDVGSVDPNDGLPVKALGGFSPNVNYAIASTGVARPRPSVPVYLNPFDARDPVRNQANLQAVATSCMKHGYILGVQLHKLIGLE